MEQTVLAFLRRCGILNTLCARLQANPNIGLIDLAVLCLRNAADQQTHLTVSTLRELIETLAENLQGNQRMVVRQSLQSIWSNLQGPQQQLPMIQEQVSSTTSASANSSIEFVQLESADSDSSVDV